MKNAITKMTIQTATKAEHIDEIVFGGIDTFTTMDKEERDELLMMLKKRINIIGSKVKKIGNMLDVMSKYIHDFIRPHKTRYAVIGRNYYQYPEDATIQRYYLNKEKAIAEYKKHYEKVLNGEMSILECACNKLWRGRWCITGGNNLMDIKKVECEVCSRELYKENGSYECCKTGINIETCGRCENITCGS